MPKLIAWGPTAAIMPPTVRGNGSGTRLTSTSNVSARLTEVAIAMLTYCDRVLRSSKQGEDRPRSVPRTLRDCQDTLATSDRIRGTGAADRAAVCATAFCAMLTEYARGVPDFTAVRSKAIQLKYERRARFEPG